MKNIIIRLIEPADNPAIASVIKNAMIELDAAKEGTIFTDPTLDNMFENYQDERSEYYVAEFNGKVIGGAGIRQLDGTKDNICELQRMFLNSDARGKGIGRLLMEKSMEFAKSANYSACYLETLPKMTSAVAMYHKFGFNDIDNSMGCTGHFGCNYWMLKRFE